MIKGTPTAMKVNLTGLRTLSDLLRFKRIRPAIKMRLSEKKAPMFGAFSNVIFDF